MTNSIKILRTVQQVRQWRLACKLKRETVGFIPTMGALHDGHCSLVAQSLKDNDRTILSIFVNPSQFAPHEDLDSYPRNLDSDLAKLTDKFTKKPVDAVFVPKVSEMYPSGITLDREKQRGTFVTVEGVSEQLEGVTRPLFFRGVATIVTKLLNVVTPERVYFGQKDAQQCVVIKTMVKDLLMDTEVVVIPTVRESNGLASSSRNEYLSDEVKEQSSIIQKALKAGEAFYEEKKKDQKVASNDIVSIISSTIKNATPFEIEYISVNHPETLDELQYITPGTGAVVSTVVKVPKEDGSGVARLLDNVILQ